MKSTDRLDTADLRAEYDFAAMKGGVRGKYVRQFSDGGSNIVVLDPEVAEAFPSDAAVNEALRGVLQTTRSVRRTGGLSNKTLQSSSRPRSPSRPKPRSRTVRG